MTYRLKGWMIRATRRWRPGKFLFVNAIQERDLLRFILSSYFYSNTQHVAIYSTADFCYRKVVNDGGKGDALISTTLQQQGLSPCARGRFLSLYQTI